MNGDCVRHGVGRRRTAGGAGAGAGARCARFRVVVRGGVGPMAEKKKETSKEPGSGPSSPPKSGTATAKPKRSQKSAPKNKPPQMLPPWKVLLHNDDKNEV